MEKSRYFRFDVLQRITKQFAEERKLGGGGYGVVYKGVQDDGEVIAVKKLHNLPEITDTAFDNEIHNLSEVDHPNVVRVIGYCHETQRQFFEQGGQRITAYGIERLLCFEYVEGGSLDKHISADRCDLDWPTCYGIIRGTCEGLNHLHAQRQPIYHRDLKPENILLDRNMMPKIADLGLSKIVDSTATYKTQSQLKGSLGYMPPEYANSGGEVSPTFDVFSLGVIIIRILDGNSGNSRRYEMPRQEFIDRVTNNWKERLQGTSRSSQEINIQQVKMCVDIALRCVEDNRSKRPRVHEIVKKMKALEAEIGKLSPKIPKDLTHQISSHYSYVLAIDPSLELRVPFEPMKDIPCLLQLTNKTDSSIAYNIKTNNKYRTQPNQGILPPCSRTCVCVTLLRAQEQAPTTMQCDDVVVVQCFDISKRVTSDEITEGFSEMVISEKVLDEVTLPIVYIALDQFRKGHNLEA